jgi:hypothetical protein
LKKKFFFGERITAELAVEFANVLNRMQVCGGGGTLGTSPTGFGFGSSTVCQGNTPRRGQAFFTIKF